LRLGAGFRGEDEIHLDSVRGVHFDRFGLGLVVTFSSLDIIRFP